MEAKTKDLWVFIETNGDGSAKNVGLELLGEGRGLADKQGGQLVGVVIGHNADAAVKASVAGGADKTDFKMMTRFSWARSVSLSKYPKATSRAPTQSIVRSSAFSGFLPIWIHVPGSKCSMLSSRSSATCDSNILYCQ